MPNGGAAAPRPPIVAEEPVSALAEYARIPISFEVREVLDVATPASGLGGLTLTLRRLEAPYVKDYDAPPAEGPLDWGRRFDLTHWGLLTARVGQRRVGGAAVVMRDPAVSMLDGRGDRAALWDLRVAPEARGRGVGAALFQAVEEWVSDRGARELVVETQNVNVPACRFYARRGCVLGAIHRFAYSGLPDEAQLLWFKTL